MSKFFKKTYIDTLRKLDEHEIKKFGSLLGGATVSPYAPKQMRSKTSSKPKTSSKQKASASKSKASASKSKASASKLKTAVPVKITTNNKKTNNKKANNKVPAINGVRVVDKSGGKFNIISEEKELKLYEGKTLKGKLSRANIKGIWVKDDVLHILKTDNNDLPFLLSGFDKKNTIVPEDYKTIAMYLQFRRPSNKKVKKDKKEFRKKPLPARKPTSAARSKPSSAARSKPSSAARSKPSSRYRR